MATTQSATVQDLIDELTAGMPPGFTDAIDLLDPAGPGPLLDATAQVLYTCGVAQIDDLRDQLCPTTCNSATLYDWEVALAVDRSRIALAGSVDQRRAQVIARLQEWGVPTLALIKQVVYTYFGYSSPNDVVIIETPRNALRALHTYTWTGPEPVSQPVTWKVLDGGVVGGQGAQVDIQFGNPAAVELSGLTVTMTSPGGQVAARNGLAVGLGPSPTTLRLCYPEFAGAAIYGTWTMTIAGGLSATLVQAQLFTEGVGLDTGGASGRGTAIFYWGVMFEEAKSSGIYDLVSARRAVKRLTYGSWRSDVLRRSSGSGALPAGNFAAIPDDPGSLPDAAIPG